MAHSCSRTRALAVRAVCALFTVCAPAVELPAQNAPPSVRVASFGVDTSAADVAQIVGLVRAYLAQPQKADADDRAARQAGLWSTATWADERHGDLSRGFVYQGFPATIVGVTAAAAGDSVYIVKVLYAAADSTRTRISPVALQRLYAIRAPEAPHGWQLGTALPRLTSHWTRQHSGSIHFWYAPDMTPDSSRAASATRFVAELSQRFNVAPPERLDYFVTSSPDEYHRIVGLDYFVRPSGPGTATGGMALGEGIVLSGDPSQGEAYLHELAHAVLLPLEIRNHFVSEGIATWLGGSQGRDVAQLVRVLGDFQRERSDVSLEQLIRDAVPDGGQFATVAWYATAALFVDAVHERAGMAGVRALSATDAGTDATLRLLQDGLGGELTDAERWWRGLTTPGVRD